MPGRTTRKHDEGVSARGHPFDRLGCRFEQTADDLEQEPMNHDLETVVELQQAQDDLREARRLLDGIPSWMEELHAEHSERKAVIDGYEAEVEAAASVRRAAEAEIADLKEKVKHYQGQIGLVTSQREYGALLQEIDTAKRQI